MTMRALSLKTALEEQRTAMGEQDEKMDNIVKMLAEINQKIGIAL